jgi:hypothetical protein
MGSSGGMAAGSRLPVPGRAFGDEERIENRRIGPGAQPLRAGMAEPSVTDDGWWLTHLWVADDAGVVEAIELAPLAGPPPGAPLAALGPRLAGALSGLIAEEDGRQLIRLRMADASDDARPWQRPMLIMLAIRWDPVRAAVMSREELGRELVVGFAAAAEALGRPG